MIRRFASLAAPTLVAAILSAPAVHAAPTGPNSDSQPAIPTCARPIGTLTVAEPQNAWWVQYQLDSPEALIKVFVSESRCFTLVDRGRGMAAAQAERALAGSGQMRVGSNVGLGQMKAADYVLVPDVAQQNHNARGRSFGGILGGFAGAALGGLNISSKTANVVLTLTDVRSTEQVSLQQGHAEKKSVRWGGAAGGWVGVFAAAGLSSYTNTEIGQVVAEAYLQAFTRMVDDIQSLDLNPRADNVGQAVRVTRQARMYRAADLKAAVVLDLDPGALLYPTGEKNGIWWQVSDELGNEGWVPSTAFQLAR